MNIFVTPVSVGHLRQMEHGDHLEQLMKMLRRGKFSRRSGCERFEAETRGMEQLPSPVTDRPTRTALDDGPAGDTSVGAADAARAHGNSFWI